MADWLPAVIGAGSALSGVGLTLWASSRQTRARIAAEDAARSWEHRRQVYVEFRRALFDLQVHLEGSGLAYTTPTEVYQERVFGCLNEVAFFGTVEAVRLADEAYAATVRAGRADQPPPTGPLEAFVAQAREDLRVPD